MSSEVETAVLPEFEPESREEDEELLTRPSLVHLNQEQLEALRDFKRNGVHNRRELLHWLLRLQYRTLGKLPDFWYYHIATRPAALSVVLTGDERGSYGRGETDVSPDEAEHFRRRLVAKYLRPACRDALRELRTSSNEYLEEALDVEKMASLAMRPALDEFYQRQEEALQSFLDGFDDVDALDEWLHELDLATFGAIKDVDDEFDYRVLNETVTQRACLNKRAERYELARERIAARFLLPAFNLAVREVAEKAGETDLTSRDESGGVEV